MEGWVNVDFRPTPAADKIADVTKLHLYSWVEIGKIEHILMNAVLPGIRNYELDATLKSWYDCLMPGGLLEIHSIPDFERIARAYLNKELGIIGPVFDLFNVWRYTHGQYTRENYEWQIHKTIFDKDRVVALFKNAGFEVLKLENAFWGDEKIDVNINVVGRKPLPMEVPIEPQAVSSSKPQAKESPEDENYAIRL